MCALRGLFATIIAVAAATQLEPVRLRVEHLLLDSGSPVLVAAANPATSFSWELRLATNRGLAQTGYELEVSTDSAFAATPACHASAASNATRVVPCDLSHVDAGRVLYVRVRINGSDDAAAPAPSAWTSGRFVRGGADAAGGWVALEGTPISRPVRLRCVVAAPAGGAPLSAVAFVMSPAYYLLSSSAQPLKEVSTTPMTEYKTHVYSDAYDITALFAAASSVALGVRVGGGPWAAAAFATYTKATGLPIAVTIVFVAADGTRTVVSPQWRGAADSTISTDWYEAEIVDNRLAVAFDGWDTPVFSDATWKAATPYTAGLGAASFLHPQMQPPVRHLAILRPASVSKDGAGKFVASFPQNFAGTVELDVPVTASSAGTIIMLRAGERLFPNGSVWNQLASNMTLVWTLRGGPGAIETIAPSFPFWGFQHVELSGWPANSPDPTPVSFRGLPSSTLFERTAGLVFGGIKPSADIANAYAAGHGPAPPGDGLLDTAILAGSYHAIVSSQQSNFQALPSDCPNREKRGWTGDGAVSARQAVSHFDMLGPYATWIASMLADSEKNSALNWTAGLISNIVPSMDPPAALADAAWGLALVEVSYQTFKTYGDDRLLRLAYPAMREWVRYLVRMTDPVIGLMINQSQFGDWDAQFPRTMYVPATEHMGATGAHLRAARILAELAPLAGYPEDLAEFEALFARSVEPFNTHYALNLTNGTYGDGVEQTLAVIPLAVRLVPATNLAAVQQWLVHDLETTQGLHLSTGATGTRFLFEEALAQMGRTDLAASIAAQSTLPSHGFWVTEGGTTCFENWSGEEDAPHPPPPTHNHIFLCSHAGFMYERLLGLRQSARSVGFASADFEPPAIDSLPSMSGFVNTFRGMLSFSWAWAGAPMASSIALNMSICPNVAGTVIVPVPSLASPVVSEGGVVVWRDGAFVPGRSGITAATRLPGGAISFSLGSGFFSFATSTAASHEVASSRIVSLCARLEGEPTIELVCPAGSSIGYITRAGVTPQRRHRFLITHVLERLCLRKRACRLAWSDVVEAAQPADISAATLLAAHGAEAEACVVASCVDD